MYSPSRVSFSASHLKALGNYFDSNRAIASRWAQNIGTHCSVTGFAMSSTTRLNASVSISTGCRRHPLRVRGAGAITVQNTLAPVLHRIFKMYGTEDPASKLWHFT